MTIIKKLTLAGLFVFALASFFQAAATAQDKKPFTDDGTIKAILSYPERNGARITLNVEVIGPNDKPLDLGELEFEVMEDDKRVLQKRFVTEDNAPRGTARVTLVIDYSASMMARNKIDGAKKAALALLNLLRDNNDQLGLYLFNGRLDATKKKRSQMEVLPMGTMDAKRRTLARQAIEATPLGNGTPLFDAMKEAALAMEKNTGRQVMIVLTDGMDTEGKAHQEECRKTILRICKEKKIPIYMISFPGHNNEAAMKGLALATKGKHLVAALPDDLQKPDDLANQFVEIGKKLQKAYVLEYDSPNRAEDGLVRNVTVTVRSGQKGTQTTNEYSVPAPKPASPAPEK